MSYTKKTWASGETVTSSALNNMETGIDTVANPFVVTLTPTEEDYSGTMDKTVAEIQTAYDAGKSIVFRIVTGVNEYTDIPCAFASKFGNLTYMNFAANLFFTTMNLLVVAETLAVDDGTKQTYSTTIYPLTPMS